MIRTAWLSLALLLLAACGEPDEESAADLSSPLLIYSTTDSQTFRPVIADFERLYPRIKVQYVELDAAVLNRRYLDETEGRRSSADLLLSSAMDLQVKLINDGYGTAHVSQNGAKLPSWARWRNEAFGVTFEPAVMVYNTRLLTGHVVPKSRPELLRDLRRDPVFWSGRVGTYDIAKSSVGYLLASQDARQNSDFGALLEAFGASGLRTSPNTAALLDDIEAGRLALGYNLLGSYARARVERGARLTIVYPADYTLAVSRTAIVPRSARHLEAAHVFLEYLLSLRGQKALTALSRLNASRPEVVGPYSQLGIAESQVGPLRPIPLGPGLLAYLDEQKHRRLIDSWQHAVRQPHEVALTGE